MYPGVTEEICIPILEAESKLICGIDFKVGYSPERINPGDKVHRLETIIKVVSGIDADSLEEIAKVYELVVKAGVHKAPNIKVAEAAKVIENTQRDINIAFMNELSVIFNKMNINTKDVLEAAGTKWNFLNFQPGLVGGHCIGVDPYYLTFKAKKLGIEPKIALAGREINDNMAFHVAYLIDEELARKGKYNSSPKIGILGFTFKEDCPDIRNTKVIDLYYEFHKKDYEVFVSDPLANKFEVKTEYGIELIDFNDLKDLDVLIIAVAHKYYKNLNKTAIHELFSKRNHKVLFDLKSIIKYPLVDDTIRYLSL